MNKNLIIVITLFVLTGIILLVVLTKFRSGKTCSGNANWSGTDCYGDKSRLIAVGSESYGLHCGFYSDDPKMLIWKPIDALNGLPYQGIVWNGSIYASISCNTIVYSDTTGMIWNNININCQQPINCFGGIVTNGLIFVAVKGSSIFYSDTTGVSWSCATIEGNSINAMYCVTWNGTYFLAGGENRNFLYYSSDGKKWKSIPFHLSDCRSIVCNGNYCIAVGRGSPNLCISTDGGLIWNTNSSVLPLRGDGICYGVACNNNGSIFVVVGRGGVNISYSTDRGVTWKDPSKDVNGNSFTLFPNGGGLTVKWNGSVFIAGGIGKTSDDYTIAYSTDGKIWIPIANSFNLLKNVYGIS